MALFNTIRAVSFATLLVFSLITLGISAYWISTFPGYTPNVFTLGVSVITWAFLLPMFLIGILRTGSFLSWVAVELGIVGLLCVLWLTAAAYTTPPGGEVPDCTSYLYRLHPELQSECRQGEAFLAFSWLNWLILFSYLVFLSVHVKRAHSQGHSIWVSDINGMGSLGTGTGAGQTSPKDEHSAQPMQQNNIHIPHVVESQYNHPQTQSGQPIPQV